MNLSEAIIHNAIFGSGGGENETITVTSDCTNAKQVDTLFRSTIFDQTKIVAFRNKKWVANPTGSDMVENTCLIHICLPSQFHFNTENGDGTALIYRWRNGDYSPISYTNEAYDLIINAGDVFEKVIIG